jgi:STAM-binding protein
VYAAEGNDPQTYLLLYRHAQLVLNHLDHHPERSLPENRVALKASKAAVLRDLEKLEEIRPRIARRHAEYLERRKVQRNALEALEGRSAQMGNLPAELDGLSISQSRSQGTRRSREKTTLDAGEHRSLAAKLAHREVTRRDTARRGVRQAGVSEEQEQERRTGGVWVEWEKDLHRRSNGADNELSQQLQEVSRLQNGHATTDMSVRPGSLSDICTGTDRREQRPTSMQPTSHYHYPSIPHKSAQERWSESDSKLPTQRNVPERPPKEVFRRPSDLTRPPALPPKPPKIPTPGLLFESPQPPPVPRKYIDTASSAPPLPGKYLDSTSSSLRSSSPGTDGQDLDEFTFKPSAYLENGDALRTVFLPPTLRHQFLAAASQNTRLNLETCGILCGILKSNALFITRLVIPEQKSTSDTCETVNEQELFDYCDKEELMVLGWIHTHPTQTCFMSSRDLHTHVGYQVMMPESIAIVCAPTKQPQ